MQVLSQRVRDASDQFLTPALRSATPEGRATADAALVQLRQRPTIQAAERIADDMIQEDLAAGRLPAEAANDPIQRLHDIKIVLQAQASDPMALSRDSLGRIDNMALVSAADEIGRVLRSAAPGYDEAMTRLQETITPREIMRFLENAQRGDVVNVAGAALRNPGVRRSLDRPGMEGVARALREENELYAQGMRMTPGFGSRTAPMAMDMADQMAMEAPRIRGPQEMLNSALDVITAGARERSRNTLGRALYEPVDSGLEGYDPARVEEVRQILQRELQRRTRGAQTAAGGGAAGGIAGGME
jgi:hypothetical protein